MRWKLKNFFFRFASYFLRIESLIWQYLRFTKLPFTNWTIKSFVTEASAVFALEIKELRCQSMNYHRMFESSFKITSNCKLCDKAILIKRILTLDNSITPLTERYWNRYKDNWWVELFHLYKFIFDSWISRLQVQ